MFMQLLTIVIFTSIYQVYLHAILDAKINKMYFWDTSNALTCIPVGKFTFNMQVYFFYL